MLLWPFLRGTLHAEQPSAHLPYKIIWWSLPLQMPVKPQMWRSVSTTASEPFWVTRVACIYERQYQGQWSSSADVECQAALQLRTQHLRTGCTAPYSACPAGYPSHQSRTAKRLQSILQASQEGLPVLAPPAVLDDSVLVGQSEQPAISVLAAAEPLKTSKGKQIVKSQLCLKPPAVLGCQGPG